MVQQHLEIDLGSSRARGQPYAVQTRRVQLAGIADDHLADNDLGAPAGMPGGVLRAGPHRGRRPAQRATVRHASTASAQPAGVPEPHQPAGDRRPDTTTPRCSGWSGKAASSCLNSSIVGAAVDAEPGRLRTLAGKRQEDAADLVEAEVGLRRDRRCAPSVTQQPGQQGRAQQRLLVGERVGDPHRRPARIVGGEAECVPVAIADERIAEHLDVASRRQREADPTAQPLPRSEPASGGCGWQHARDLVIADDADDFFDQVVADR